MKRFLSILGLVASIVLTVGLLVILACSGDDPVGVEPGAEFTRFDVFVCPRTAQTFFDCQEPVIQRADGTLEAEVDVVYLVRSSFTGAVFLWARLTWNGQNCRELPNGTCVAQVMFGPYDPLSGGQEFTIGFGLPGMHTLLLSLRDVEGEELRRKVVSIEVSGDAPPTPQAPSVGAGVGR